ncbi:MAG: glycosyltransferase family 4 protein [candidate division KSB1 bacterium]|nr:glycosyltransferase family 4 protein [candidate division KSB1 bacterium]MDZ7335039.1 glycosyltransferase family 4 protein [candidate division KSB1 bacterium]MDZ7399408.1 glycosyltransferase family 4 protein [candidate division KSB1 bacterium]
MTETNSKLTVLIVGPSIALRGGVAHHLRTLLYSPLAQNFNLHYFRVGSEYRDTRLHIFVRSLITPFAFFIKLLRTRANVVHFNPSFDRRSLIRELTMLAICKISGFRAVVQFHGGNLAGIMSNGRLPLYMRFMLKWAHRYVVLTETQKQPLLEFVPLEKIAVIPNMVDTSMFIKPKQKQNFIILFMSRIDAAKGVYEVVQTIPEIIGRFPEAKFIFAGEGPDRTKLELLCCSNGLARQVKFLGYIDDEQKVNFLAQGDVFLFPSQLCEGLPYSLLEAMAAGLPIIATSVGAVPEIIQNGKNGFLIPPGDSQKLAEFIICLLTRPKLRNRMARLNRKIAEQKYDINIVCNQFKQLYEQIACNAS